MAKFIVHPGTGTIIDLADNTLLIDINDAIASDMTDDDILDYAQAHGEWME